MTTATHTTRQMAESTRNGAWIRADKRLAIYLRDGLACVWCGADLETDQAQLTLDHLRPYSRGGTNDESNLVTACRRCNCSRGSRSVRKFSAAVAHYLDREGVGEPTPREIETRVRRHARRALKPYRAQAREIIAARD